MATPATISIVSEVLRHDETVSQQARKRALAELAGKTPDRWVMLGRAMQVLGVSRQTIVRHRKREDWPVRWRVENNRCRFNLEDLERFAREGWDGAND